MASPVVPYVIGGKIFDSDGVTARPNLSMTMTNLRTGEQITTTSNSLGEFAFDSANFASGYNDEDYVVVSTNATGQNGKDLRIKIIARGYGQIEEVRVAYSTKT